MELDFRACNTDLLLSDRVAQVPGLGEAVVCPLDLVGDFPGPDAINIGDVLPAVDHTCHHFGLLHHRLYRVIRLSKPYWIDESFFGLNRSLSVVHLSQLFSINIDGWLKFVEHA